MREEEIVKALEWMREEDPNGFLSDILDLINRKKAEKEELEFELIRSRNEMKAWKIRASWYKEKSSKLECKNSELEIELKAMRDAVNSYKSDVERLQLAVLNCNSETKRLERLNRCQLDRIHNLKVDKKTAKNEARKEFAERLKKKAEIVSGGDYGFTYEIGEDEIDNLLAEMESERE